MSSLYESLHRLWYIYCESPFYRNPQGKLEKMLGWEIKEKEKYISYLSTLECMYKDHIMIKKGFMKGRNTSPCDTYNIYLANDINDQNPVLIYYCYDHEAVSYSNITAEGWVNIGPWSMFANKLIEDSMEIYNKHEKDKELKEFFDKEDFFTKDLKPELRDFFKDQVKKLDSVEYDCLLKKVLSNKSLNDITRKQDENDAEAVLNKLSGRE